MKPRVTRFELDDPELLELVSPEMDHWRTAALTYPWLRMNCFGSWV